MEQSFGAGEAHIGRQSGGKVVFTRGVETFMERNQMKVQWQGEVVSVQPRSTVWRYLIDNRTHRENGYNVFLKGEVCSNDEAIQLGNRFDKYDYCVAISERQAVKVGISIGDIINLPSIVFLS